MEKISDEVFNLYNNRRELFSNKEFMLEMLKIDPRFIIYDGTDDNDVYLEFTRLMSEFISKNGSDSEYNNYYIGLLANVANEISNPREGSKDLYKIPHEFLYEQIRNSILLELMNDDMYVDKFSAYFELDLKYPKEYGETLEKLYRDASANLYFAGANSHEEIFREGYQINYAGWIDRNFWNAHDIASGFLAILYPGKYGREETIFASIPKDDKLVLGSNGEVSRFGKIGEEKYAERTYLLPEYIIGSTRMVDGEAKFINNDIPLSERVQYENIGECLETAKYYDDAIHEVSGRSSVH